MVAGLYRFLRLAAILPVIFWSCRPDDITGIPETRITATPAQAATTDILEIKAVPVSASSQKEQLFYRWDWNGDGVWDTRFSSDATIWHRYYQPGAATLMVEIINGRKESRTFSLSLQIARGYSPPVAAFTITPPTGNPTIEFVFDASSTKDAEDSLELLEFRWDPLGDGRWLLPYSQNPVATYQYARPGIYEPRLQVKDPSGRSSTLTGYLEITRIDSLLQADFRCRPDSVERNKPVVLDASLSKYLPDTTQKLVYSWLLPESVTWTEPSFTDTIVHTFTHKGANAVSLKIIHPVTEYYNILTREQMVYEENRPPSARFRVGSARGNILTQFFFDAWSSTDDRLPPTELVIRWDFEGDGVWDTPASKEKSVYHQYAVAGVYHPTVEVFDDGDQSSRFSLKVDVSGNSNPTDFFTDHRDGRYYGMVRIGSQWWMSENLNYTVPGKLISGFNQWLCLLEKPVQCDQLGKMYNIGATIHNRYDNDFVVVCPSGWHLPSREDWEELFQSIGGEENGKELRYGGKYDFNALDMGYGDYEFVYGGGSIVAKDTLYSFHDTYQKSWFYSTTEPADVQNLRVDVWMWNVDRATGVTWTGYGMPFYYMPVRCVKND